MKNLIMRGQRPSLWIAIVVPLLVFALACGAADEPTATATATVGPVATPTPTTEAPPTPTTPTDMDEPQYGGTLLNVVGYYPTDNDAHVTGNSSGMAWFGNKVNVNFFVNYVGATTECETCDNWELDNGGKTMVLNMVEGIKFHDGREMTSADLKYSLEKIMGQVDGVVSPRVGVIKEYIESIDTPTRYQLRINLVRPSIFMQTVLAMSYAIIFPDGTTHEDLVEKTHGAGPFILEKAITGASWHLVKNQNYFKPGLPYLDEVDVINVGEATTRNANFLSHKVEYASISTPQILPQLFTLRDEGIINHGVSDGGCGPHFVAMNNLTEPFNDIKMRKAVNLALDREELGLIMHGERAVPQVFFFTGNHPLATSPDEIWNIYPGWGTGAKKAQEIEEAKQWVIDAGFSDGISFDMMARGPSATTGWRASYAPIQEMLGEIGINIKIDLIDGTTHAVRMQALDYTMQSYIFCIPTRQPDEWIGTYWITGGARNWFVYSNPVVDRLFIEMSGELDPAKQKAIFFQLQELIVVDEVGFAPLPTTDGLLWWWKTIHNVDVGIDGFGHNSSGLHRADRLWLDQ